jgi:hypothetical protein
VKGNLVYKLDGAYTDGLGLGEAGGVAGGGRELLKDTLTAEHTIEYPRHIINGLTHCILGSPPARPPAAKPPNIAIMPRHMRQIAEKRLMFIFY